MTWIPDPPCRCTGDERASEGDEPITRTRRVLAWNTVYALQEVEQDIITHQGVRSSYLLLLLLFWRKSYLLLRKLLLNKRLFVSKDGLVLDHFLLSECRYSLPFYCFGFLSERSYSEPRSYLFGNLVGEIICGRGVTPRGQGNCHRHGYSRIRI